MAHTLHWLAAMADPVRSPSVALLHTVSGLLGDPDDALVRVARRPLLWVALYGAWLGVLGCFVAGAYPAIRTLALALAMVVVPGVAAVLATMQLTGAHLARAFSCVIGCAAEYE